MIYEPIDLTSIAVAGILAITVLAVAYMAYTDAKDCEGKKNDTK